MGFQLPNPFPKLSNDLEGLGQLGFQRFDFLLLLLKAFHCGLDITFCNNAAVAGNKAVHIQGQNRLQGLDQSGRIAPLNPVDQWISADKHEVSHKRHPASREKQNSVSAGVRRAEVEQLDALGAEIDFQLVRKCLRGQIRLKRLCVGRFEGLFHFFLCHTAGNDLDPFRENHCSSDNRAGKSAASRLIYAGNIFISLPEGTVLENF